jgi:hypothetical protein
MTRKIESKVPKHYWPQVQLQLEITDLEECDFVQYRPAKDEGSEAEFVVVRIKRDREWFTSNLHLMQKAWDRIVAGRAHGLCEIKDDVIVPRLREEISCDVKDDGLQTQEQVSDLQGL